MATKKTNNTKDKEIVETQVEECGIRSKKLIWTEVIVCFASVILYVISMFMCSYAMEELDMVTVPVILIIVSTIMFLTVCFTCFSVEYKLGYHVCKNCQHKHVPTFIKALCAPHIGWTRYLKCPKCNKWSWQKKVFKK